MKTLSQSLLFAAMVLFTGSIFTQWSPDIRLTTNTGESWTTDGKECIAYASNVLHTVWFDRRFGDEEIMYKRSIDGGNNWEAVVRLTNNIGASQYPAIIAIGNYVFVVWRDLRDGNYEIYFKRSTDKGITWENDLRLTNNSSESIEPSIAIFASTIQVAWTDSRDGNKEIYLKRSTDNGVNWDAVQRITNNAAVSEYPSITTISNNTIIVWQDERDGNKELYFNKSTNSGASWSSDIRLTNNSNSSAYPDVSAVSNGAGYTVHVLWSDNRDGNYEIYYKSSTDNGSSWGSDQRITNNVNSSTLPVADVSGQNIYLVWEDFRSGTSAVYYNRSTNSGISWGSDLKLNNSAAYATAPSLCIYNTGLHVIWADERDNDLEIYYKQNPTGNITAVNSIGNEITEKFSISQNYPNPFNPVTNIEFSIPNAGTTRLVIYDALGREIESLVNKELNPGTYRAEWNASNYYSGVYFYRLTSGNYTETKKMILVK